MNSWWQTLDPGSRASVVLLQVDIGGHSAWLAKASAANYLEPYRERARLHSLLTNALASRGYHQLFWAGDGGVFAGCPNRAGHPEMLCDAADAIFSIFKPWSKGKDVEIRVTATTMMLNVDPDPGNWCGPGFNTFLKYERQLALPNAFVITQELRVALVNDAERRRFKKTRRIPLPDGEVVTTYIDKNHPFAVKESPLGFGVWLRHQIQSQNLPESALVERSSLIRVGNCTVLDTAHQVSGYGEIVFEPQAPLEVSSSIDDQDKDAWETTRRELEERKVSGTSLQVTQFTPELTDDPHPRLRYQTVAYKDARAFSLILERQRGASARYRARALDVLASEGTIAVPTRLPCSFRVS